MMTMTIHNDEIKYTEMIAMTIHNDEIKYTEMIAMTILSDVGQDYISGFIFTI
jgi:hypothetical protein